MCSRLSTTPLVVLRNQLEETVVGNLPESAVTKLQQALKNANQVIDCSQSAISLGKADWKTIPRASVVEFELYAYIMSAGGYAIVMSICAIFS